MISALTGELRRVEDDRVHVQVGPLLYELLVPAADVPELRGGMGREITFHTMMYLEGDPSRGNLEPRMIGFLRVEDRRFFELFTTVKGIGTRTALRALTAPVGQIAHAIEARDARFLSSLPKIGKRTAEQVIAELAGKAERFAVAYGAKQTPIAAKRTADEEDAIVALMNLGERRPDAEHLLERAKQGKPDLSTARALITEMLRLRTVRP